MAPSEQQRSKPTWSSADLRLALVAAILLLALYHSSVIGLAFSAFYASPTLAKPGAFVERATESARMEKLLTSNFSVLIPQLAIVSGADTQLCLILFVVHWLCFFPFSPCLCSAPCHMNWLWFV